MPPRSALRRFLDTETAGGVALLIATAAALVWANSPWSESYETLWSTDLSIRLGDHRLALDLHEWVNDGLMAIFFLVVGLEIKRELVEGELRDPRKAALPAVAAVGGMVVPALLYVVVNVGGEGSKGWGIPMATDIAFALGFLALLGSRVHPSLKPFLLTLAIVDDIGAILVIAVFYSGGIHWNALGVAAALLLAILVLRRLGITETGFYVILGVGVWLAVHESGVHATIAGVVLGLLAPTKPELPPELIDEYAQDIANVSTARDVRATRAIARRSISTVEWLEHELHPWTSFAIIPLFALANAGIPLGADALRDAASSAVTYGVVLGLVVGKLVGITAAAWIATRVRVASLPDGVSWREVGGVAAIAGIGFTVSLFVTDLAFDATTLQSEAKVGIVAASVIAPAIGALLLLRGPSRGTRESAPAAAS